MSRSFLPALFVAFLLGPTGAFAQSAQHDTVEVIDTPALLSPDEQKPDLADVTNFIVEQTNTFREKEKRPKVATNTQLVKTAREFAAYMAKTGRYGHTADGTRPADRATKQGYDYCIVLENIAYAFHSKGFSSDALGKTFVDGWMKSPGHRRNMLDPDVTETGVAVARSEKTGYYFAVQLFGRPKAQAIHFKVTNSSGTTVSYTIDDQAYSLPPRYTRTHEQCRPTSVAFDLPAGEKTEQKTLTAETGSRFLITARADR